MAIIMAIILICLLRIRRAEERGEILCTTGTGTGGTGPVHLVKNEIVDPLLRYMVMCVNIYAGTTSWGGWHQSG